MSSPHPEKGRFCLLDPDIRGGGPGTDVEISNEQALLTPPRLIIRPFLSWRKPASGGLWWTDAADSRG
ncbi:DUF1629 domain-containing protein [Xanthomonas phaseoli pv. dieffenbachiae]|nr:DUF1629 domain-containing protein [Xanthomonas phaseoli]MBO9831219.1 DUF1629 domain-containing protein [Xanthomonas phaseoli pv. dieffenbachiae]MBO9837554.1 DUF1629 domain-containing protein [Xanthomonas phaseoli pv. dieffenbachiae]MBO9839206.1 DUF1629 domain-containing protein [Xanthomonas phaseoli pv. dieffenbachiae]MBO9861189.1 DUF1629 domain-containing protein [Xanthomonas phaseoli pv. dieffenbachiae]MBO9865065.1 DUF1629 domain-containing protein [Xanthomonas phaseoli pv. dieffenbachiae